MMQNFSNHGAGRRLSCQAPRTAPSIARVHVALTMGALLAVAAVSGCAPRTSTQSDLDAIVAAPNLTTTVKAIAADPQRFIGRVVTVSGEVGQVFGPRWFTIGGTDFDGAEVLVLGRSTLPGILSNLADSGKVMNDIVQITGVVRTFEEDALETEIGGGLDLDGDVFDAFDEHPVIVMTDLDLTPRIDVVPAVAVPVVVPVAPPIVDELVIIDTPDRTTLSGRSVALLGAKVQGVNNTHSFWVGPDTGQRLLVVLDAAAAARAHVVVKPGETVGIAGVMQPIPANLDEVQSRWGLTPLDRARLALQQVYLSASRVVVMNVK